MASFRESTVDYADFTFERQKVVCYGLQNNIGGTTTILNFPSLRLAREFRAAFLDDRSYRIIQNKAQLICLTDYATVMRNSDEDTRVRTLTFHRDYMMGTLAHAM